MSNTPNIVWRHVFGYGGAEGGITIGVQKHNFKDYPNSVAVYLSRCNPKDSFCKKTGREQALKNELHHMCIKELPAFIANYTVRVYDFHKPERFFRKEVEHWSKFALQFVD